MSYKEPCPICATQMTEYHDMIDVYNGMGPTSEHYLDCPNKCYHYSYAYGSTDVYIKVGEHHVRFGWSYHDTHQTIKDEGEAIDLVCGIARTIYHEDQAQRPQEPR